MPKAKSKLPESIRKLPLNGEALAQPYKKPLWKGPLVDGVTNSLLCKFLVCKERFRIQTIEGLDEPEGWNHSIDYGTMWHAAEEACAQVPKLQAGLDAIIRESEKFKGLYPTHHRSIDNYTGLCIYQWKAYYKLYGQQYTRRDYLLQESAFRCPYKLPSGRSVILRGKIDAVFRGSPTSYKGKTIYVQENKTKGQIDEEGITKTISQNLQCMLYFIAYNMMVKQQILPTPQASGIFYNVIRRPLSERYPIKRKQSEHAKTFWARLSHLMVAAPEKHFYRWWISLRPADVNKFIRESFNPILEDLCNWYECVTMGGDIYTGSTYPWTYPHYQMPYGVYNSLSSGFRGDYFRYLSSGDRTGLVRIKTLFPELES